jgi:hypothetical protein
MNRWAVELGCKLVAQVNAREHWSTVASRAKRQRRAARLAVESLVNRHALRPPLTVRIIRLGPRRLDDDNLAGSAKHIRDGVAEALGVDDADPAVTWAYGQEQTTGDLLRGYGCRIVLEKPAAENRVAQRARRHWGDGSRW